MAQFRLRGNFQMAEEKRKVSVGFVVFIITVELIFLGAVLGGAWVLDKTLLAPPLIVGFRLTRIRIEKKYAVLHCATVSACVLCSTLICCFGTHLSLPITVSLISNIIVGVIFAVITWKIQEAINLRADYDKIVEQLESDKTFNTETCTKEELIKRCEELKFSKENTELAIKFFIDKTKQSKIADELSIDEKSVQMRKRRLKQKLNNIEIF